MSSHSKLCSLVASGCALFLVSCSAPPVAPQTGWAKWTRSDGYVLKGQYGVAGDPSILKNGDKYAMYYGCFDPVRKPQGTDICLALSNDGRKWELPDLGNDKVRGQVMKPLPGSWHTANETPFVLSFKNQLLLYFTGYKDKGGIFKSFPADLGIAMSSNGTEFVAAPAPVMTTSAPGTAYDQSAIVSPSIVEQGGQLSMVYAAYCLSSRCVPKTGTALMTAHSADGMAWVKDPKPLFTDHSAPLPSFIRSAYDLAEAELIVGPDDYFYLFFTATQANHGHKIGVARSKTLAGPWQINPDPIIVPRSGETEVVAPNVRIEGGKVRMWFSAFTPKPEIHVGYAEARWPLFAK